MYLDRDGSRMLRPFGKASIENGLDLALEEIAERRLPQARLVVLVACPIIFSASVYSQDQNLYSASIVCLPSRRFSVRPCSLSDESATRVS